MDINEKEILQKVAHTVRALSADAIEKQKSGHPGLPLGAAEIGTYIYSKAMKHNPKNPDWMGRDRFILSAGHGSMLQYSLLHLTGYDLSMDDIKNFRLLKSKTPGHPEVGVAPGIETTTGPLGQGIAAGTGMAIAQKLLGSRFGDDLFNSKIYVLAGDGCFMEGISSEVGSLAGTLGLNNLVLVYDANNICLDGPIEECFQDDVAKRYESFGFNVLDIDGYNFDEIENAFNIAKEESETPTLIIARTIIGKYTPTREGKSDSHGKFLGSLIEGFKVSFNWPLESFLVPLEVRDYFNDQQKIFEEYENQWRELFERKVNSDPEKQKAWETYSNKLLPENFDKELWDIEISPNQPTRKYNEIVIRKVAELLPFFISGSADVASVDFTWLEGNPIVRKNDWNHQQIKFGVREFGMAGCAYGINLHGMIQPSIGTFLVFSDYMRNAVRMSAMMKQRVIYVYTHDSLLIGQDGPTHQPVEHMMSLRLIPNLTLIRPGDENEVKCAWATALHIKGGPVAICFTRQPVESLINNHTAIKAQKGLKKGAYFLYGDEYGDVDVEIFASGSEINTSSKAAKYLENDGLSVRVISVPSWELFDQQDDIYKSKILDGISKLKVSVEAGVGQGWQKFIGNKGLMISQETYGESAPEPVMIDYFGFTGDKITKRIKEKLYELNILE